MIPAGNQLSIIVQDQIIRHIVHSRERQCSTLSVCINVIRHRGSSVVIQRYAICNLNRNCVNRSNSAAIHAGNIICDNGTAANAEDLLLQRIALRIGILDIDTAAILIGLIFRNCSLLNGHAKPVRAINSAATAGIRFISKNDAVFHHKAGAIAAQIYSAAVFARLVIGNTRAGFHTDGRGALK